MTIVGNIAQAALDLAANASQGLHTEEAINAVRDRYALTEDELRVAADIAIENMLDASEERQDRLDRQREALIGRAYAWGRKVAEKEALAGDQPVTREYLIAAAERVVDIWAGHFTDKFEHGDVHEKDLVCALADGARRGFIERAVELSFVSMHEGGHA